MATPTSWAQHVITCDLCDNPTQQFCNNCQLSLCVDCVSKHVDAHKRLAHDIVSFTNRKIQLVYAECKLHPDQRCEAHCRQCDVPVCMKCVLGPHKGHDAVEVSKVIDSRKKELRKDNDEIKTVLIPKYTKCEADMKSKITKANARYGFLENEIEKKRNLWHQEVNVIFDTMGSRLQSTKENHIDTLTTRHASLRDVILQLETQLEENKKILKSIKTSEINNHKSNLKEYRDIVIETDVDIPSLKASAVQGQEFSVELGEFKATLMQTSKHAETDKVSPSPVKDLFDNARLISSISHKIKALRSMSCVGTDEVWVMGEKYVPTRIDMRGAVQKTCSAKCSKNDITVNKEGDLIYSDSERGIVNIFRNGKIETLVVLQGWTPEGICCTRSGDILVSMSLDQSRSKIVRFKGQTITQEIDKDKDGKEIFKGGQFMLFVAENNNGDICVSDQNAGVVVVVNGSGKVRFRYDGKEAMKKASLSFGPFKISREKAFDPQMIVTDSMSRIIVADDDNHRLHILDQNGQFLKCFESPEIKHPGAISVDSSGRLWVSLKAVGEIKVIEYTAAKDASA
ncbi:protein lin-41-like [Ostrea edulis]|uniref:protein lin-41-like n=1 Tax=Ostrea edulis TaxID=37623 RepID=UPI0024AEE8A2|nr:protein lin-41-like [Ostrea edulis]